MCRHLAYAGPPIRLGALLTDPPFALTHQAWAPRRQTHGTMNVDGFGVGWYVPDDPVPARHRGAGPVWGDETFAELARVVRGTGVLAAVRGATEGMPAGAAAAAPFRAGPWLFSHNGALHDWPNALKQLAARLEPAEVAMLETPTDSGLLWALVRQRLDAGAGPGEALADVVALARASGAERLNLLLTDGRTISATAAGASLVTRVLEGGGVVVASEPYDDDPAWTDVPEGSLVTASGGALAVTPL